MCSGYESGLPSKVMWCATTTAGSGHSSSSVHAPLLRLRRLLRNVARDRLVGLRHRGRGTACTSASASLRVEVADQHQRRVVRHVVGPEELAHVVDRRRLEILHAADRRVLVGMHGERLVVDDLVQPAVRLVLDPHPALFLDDLALGLEDLLVDPQRRHAIGLEPEDERQVLRRERLPEHRRVFVRVGVALPADARDQRRVPFGLDVLRALEHHVLEEVREAGAARPLVLRADVVPDLGVHDRRRVILEQDHAAARWAASSSCNRASAAGRPPSRWDRWRATRRQCHERSSQSLETRASARMAWDLDYGSRPRGRRTLGAVPARRAGARDRQPSCAAPAAAGRPPTT